MSHVSDNVGTCRQGSTKALAGSGKSSMSLSLIAWKPRIDDPSKPSPSLKTSSVSSFNGSEKCCHVPGRSQNFTSTTCTPASRARRITSVGDGLLPPFASLLVGSNVAVMCSIPLSLVGRRERVVKTTKARLRARCDGLSQNAIAIGSGMAQGSRHPEMRQANPAPIAEKNGFELGEMLKSAALQLKTCNICTIEATVR